MGRPPATPIYGAGPDVIDENTIGAKIITPNIKPPI